MPYEWESEQLDSIFEESRPEQPHTSQQQSVDDIDDVMDEAEKRFEVAQYYKLLLNDSLFENKTEASMRVEEEIRAFIKDRLGVLLGIRPSKSASSESFTDEQISVLRDFADIGEDGPEVLKAVMGRLVKKLDKKTKPKEEPVLKTVKEPSKPALKQREEPKLKTQSPKAGSHAPRGTMRKVPPNVKIPEKYKDDPTLKVEDGKVFVQNRNAQGELLWEKLGDDPVRPLYKDVTPAAVPVGVKPTPIPEGAQLSIAMQNQAQRVLQETNKGDNMIVNQLLKE